MGYAKHFFDNKDVDQRIKYQVYTSGPLNALLWGCESWNLTKKNLNKLRSFHHGVITAYQMEPSEGKAHQKQRSERLVLQYPQH
jgi:hypothetical protein